MAEEKIAERIDANLLNVPIQEITELPKVMFEDKVTNLAKRTQGSLIIKEYPTASAHVDTLGHFLMNLHLRSHLDLILFSLITLIYVLPNGIAQAAMSIHIQLSRLLLKNFEDWLCEANVPIVSATQTTRSGYGSSDVELTDTSESFGLPATADLMFALISTEDLEGLGQIMVKQLKNRYNDPTIFKRFVVGIDRAKMRLYDCEQSAQEDILDSGQEEEYTYEEPKPKKSFEGFKFS